MPGKVCFSYGRQGFGFRLIGLHKPDGFLFCFFGRLQALCQLFLYGSHCHILGFCDVESFFPAAVYLLIGPGQIVFPKNMALQSENPSR